VTERRGFTMITVLWVMSVASVVAAAGALAGRIAVDSSRNRTELDRAYWAATGCTSIVRARIDQLLRESSTDDGAASLWRSLATRLSSVSGPDRACTIEVRAAGTRLDVNAASDEMIARLLSAMGVPDGQASSMVDALADWKDSDDVARPTGAERAWYVHEQREQPRNGALVDIRELSRVRGFERLADFDTVLGVENARLSLATAPVLVLMAIPGVTREAAEAIVAQREQGSPVGDLLAVSELVSPESADSLRARYADASHVSTPTPDAWILVVRATSGFPPNTLQIETRLSRDGFRARVESTRVDP
jgi:general secretion pathway protein K